MVSPYRETPRLLLCPRCGEVLERLEEGVAVCPRCQGSWINQTTLDIAFGDARWPRGHNMWWHDELECPDCAADGTVTKMSARSSSQVMVDACPSHGLWLDRGELGRLIGLEAGADELLVLQQRITAITPDPSELAKRRRAWQHELDTRQRATAEFRERLQVEEQRKREEVERAHRAAKELEAQRTAEKQEAARKLAIEKLHRELRHERDQLVATLEALEAELTQKREELYLLQAKAVTAKHRMRELDLQLAAIERR